MRYTVTCKECKDRRVYEGNTMGEAFEQAHVDGWRSTGKMTYRVCGKCGVEK